MISMMCCNHCAISNTNSIIHPNIECRKCITLPFRIRTYSETCMRNECEKDIMLVFVSCDRLIFD